MKRESGYKSMDDRIKELESALSRAIEVMKLVLPYLDRDCDGSTDYLSNPPDMAGREFADLRDDIAAAEKVLHDNPR